MSIKRLRYVLFLAVIALTLAACGKSGPGDSSGKSGKSGKTTETGQPSTKAAGPKVLHLPMRTDGPKSLDPVKGSTVYDNRGACLTYETLLEYEYTTRPLKLRPLLLESLPVKADDGITYTFKLKKGVKFHDDAAFSGGKGRDVKSADVFYSWKRMADKKNNPKSWWLLKGAIKGFDAYREAQNAAEKFDYDVPVEGMKVIDDQTFQVVLTEPVYRFMYVLAMFQLSIVPREAVEKYGTKFGRHPVGTGPFTMKEGDWVAGKSMVLHKNPNYHQTYDPKQHQITAGPGPSAKAGDKLPIVDEVRITMFVQDNPMWLQFNAGKLDYTQVPSENFSSVFNKRTKKLKRKMRKAGIQSWALPLLDFIFRGFNMKDPLVGSLDPKPTALRHAIRLAVDLEEFNDTFYNSINIVYDGPIPPGLEGYPKDGKAPGYTRGPDIEKAKAKLVEAGYPEGKGLPEIEYWTSQSSNNAEQAEVLQRQLSKIGIKLKVRLVDFSQLIEAVNNLKAPIFGFAWGSDYPDAENNLALFYSPNKAPGSNHYNYLNLKYDPLYEKIRGMAPGPERAALYAQMRDMVLADAPYIGSMARTRFYVANPWLVNFLPSEMFYNWVKYLDVDESKKTK